MQFIRFLYVGNTVEHTAQIIEKLKKGKLQKPVTVLALASNDDQLNIFSSLHLFQRGFMKEDLLIVGIAADDGEAMNLVLRISQEAINAGMPGRLKEYLLTKERMNL